MPLPSHTISVGENTVLNTLNLGDDKPDQGSYLFLVRIWLEEDTEGQVEWRGKVQDVVTGDADAFQGLHTVVKSIVSMLPAAAVRWASNQIRNVERDDSTHDPMDRHRLGKIEEVG